MNEKHQLVATRVMKTKMARYEAFDLSAVPKKAEGSRTQLRSSNPLLFWLPRYG